MFNNEYGEAAVEVLDILDNTNKEDLEKIPPSFIKFLIENASMDYKVNFDHSKPISELHLKEKTKEILGVIYINWWCDKKEQEEYKKKIKEYEIRKQKELREKYNPDKIFENKKNSQIYSETQVVGNKTDETVIIVKHNESIRKKIFNKILNVFKK